MNMTSTPEHQDAARKMRDLVATWRENEELIRLGAYRRGTDAKVDRAIMLREQIDGFLQQGVEDITGYEATVKSLIRIAETPDPTRRQQKVSR